MPRSTVTSKGQVTIPQSIRTRLGLHTGDVIEFVEGPDGAILVRPAGLDPLSLEGSLHREGQPPVSVEDMERVIRERGSTRG
jgi:antitoxin PrlF